AEVRSSSVTTFSFNCEIKFIGAGHDLTCAKAHLANLQSRMHVQAEDCRRFRILKHTFLDEEACTSGILLFAGLEYQFNGSLPLLLQFIQDSCCTEKTGCMHIVTAGMHHTFIL